MVIKTLSDDTNLNHPLIYLIFEKNDLKKSIIGVEFEPETGKESIVERLAPSRTKDQWGFGPEIGIVATFTEVRR